MNNFWHNIDRPILMLAPMAGYTESAFRQIVRNYEPSVILVSELVSVEALKRRNEKTMRMISFVPAEKNYYGVQLFGNKEESFLESIKVVEEIGADFIDLNLGCPSPKVIGSGHGSALLKNPERTADLISSIVKNSNLPVTIKMRLGFYDDEDLITTTKLFEQAGISALAIHGRTTKQKFKGQANWEKIYEVKKSLKIPVIGNGDILSAKQAQQKIQNLDGIMIGRAAVRNPWIFRECRELFLGKNITPPPSIQGQITMFRWQAKLAMEQKNERYAILELRKYFTNFLRGIYRAAEFRDRLIRVENFAEMENIFQEIEREIIEK
jgi:tRNA-dihydrouridine synthase B